MNLALARWEVLTLVAGALRSADGPSVNTRAGARLELHTVASHADTERCRSHACNRSLKCDPQPRVVAQPVEGLNAAADEFVASVSFEERRNRPTATDGVSKLARRRPARTAGLR